MKRNILKTTLITTLGAMTMSCANERGVIVDRENVEAEKALLVNLIQRDPSKQKPLEILSDDVFDADRKLFFCDSKYMEPFDFAKPGDTIVYPNLFHKTYIDITRFHRIRKINDVPNRKIVKIVRSTAGKQK